MRLAGWPLCAAACMEVPPADGGCWRLDRLELGVGSPADEFPLMPEPPFSLATATVTRLDTNETEVSNRAFGADEDGRLVADGCSEGSAGWGCSLRAPEYSSCGRSGDWRVELVFDAPVPPAILEFSDWDTAEECPWPELCFVVSAH